MRSICTVALAAATFACQAQTTVAEPWVRGTVAQQHATGAFMRITSAQGGRLLAVSSPVAGVVEIHESSMDGGVMRMRALPSIELPAGKAVELKPGGHHVMLMALKRPLGAGTVVPLTLTIEGAGGRRETVEVQATVRPLAGAAKP